MKGYKSKKLKLIDKKLVKSLLFGVLGGITGISIFTLIFSLIFSIAGMYPADAVKYISLVFLGIGGLAGGYISARINKASGLAVGMLTGFIIFIVILIAGLSNSLGTITLFTLYKLIVLLVFSGLGGILGVNKQTKIKL